VSRREFIGLLGGAVVTWPLAARLSCAAARERTRSVEGRNVAIEYRWAEGQDDRVQTLASDLVRRQVAVIATGSTSSAVAAKAATKTIPVFAVSSDLVQLGSSKGLVACPEECGRYRLLSVRTAREPSATAESEVEAFLPT
jgi:putative tryptophan/tyrosine transport system substrate-binding protein